MAEKIGKRSVKLQKNIFVNSYAAAVGKLEGEGPLGKGFDKVFEDELLGEKSFEKAESRLQQTSLATALKKGGFTPQDIDAVFAGDLLNQCVGSSYGLRDFGIPFIGLFGACSTMALSLISVASLIESGAANRAAAVTSSHFCSAERQFRFPLEYGGQRPQTSQWTVTGSGAAVLSTARSNIRISRFTVGKIVDLGINDMNNMGAAMAPAAADTIESFLSDTGSTPADYDLILTGDLGYTGSALLKEILSRDKIDISEVHNDCGKMIFHRKRQDVHSGGSGCGCSASVLCSEVFEKLRNGAYKNILFCATGALMSPTVSNQGETIPSIAHLLNIVSEV